MGNVFFQVLLDFYTEKVNYFNPLQNFRDQVLKNALRQANLQVRGAGPKDLEAKLEEQPEVKAFCVLDDGALPKILYGRRKGCLDTL